MHDVTPRVVVWLSDADIKDTFANGQSDEIRRSPGMVDWVPAERHAGENLGAQPVEFLAIVQSPGSQALIWRPSRPLPACAPRLAGSGGKGNGQAPLGLLRCLLGWAFSGSTGVIFSAVIRLRFLRRT